MPNIVRIMNLGDIITPDFKKAMDALANILVDKKIELLKKAKSEEQKAKSNEQIEKSELYKVMMKAVEKTLLQKNPDIENLKIGKLDENSFDKTMIETIKNNSGIEISSQEFNTAWSAMNPPYEAFKTTLQEAIKFNSEPNQQLIFISLTTPKIREIKKVLEEQKLSQCDSEGNLISIGGITLLPSYVLKKSKPELIRTAIIQSKTQKQPSNLPFFSQELSSQSVEKEKKDICYIYGVNKIQFEILKNELDKTTKAVQEAAEVFRVPSKLWNKETQSLTAVLASKEEQLTYELAASRL